eukprot:SAG22_NODE_8964_length_618_cov_1.094412_2_plen_63_part_01
MLGKWEASAADAKQCLQLAPGFVKAHIRLATAELHLGRFDDAVGPCALRGGRCACACACACAC